MRIDSHGSMYNTDSPQEERMLVILRLRRKMQKIPLDTVSRQNVIYRNAHFLFRFFYPSSFTLEYIASVKFSGKEQNLMFWMKTTTTVRIIKGRKNKKY